MMIIVQIIAFLLKPAQTDLIADILITVLPKFQRALLKVVLTMQELLI